MEDPMVKLETIREEDKWKWQSC